MSPAQPMCPGKNNTLYRTDGPGVKCFLQQSLHGISHLHHNYTLDVINSNGEQNNLVYFLSYSTNIYCILHMICKFIRAYHYVPKVLGRTGMV